MTLQVPPGGTVGILGGGQLGRMLALAASRLGIATHIYDPSEGGPASQVTSRSTIAPFDDAAALEDFAKSVDVVTYEFENIPDAALDIVERHAPVRPDRAALTTSQDRLTEKQFLADLGLQTAPFAAIDRAPDIAPAIRSLGPKAILKTRRFGYDGKGQVRVTAETVPETAWQEVGKMPSVLEGFVDFSAEISVIAARSETGEVACFDPGENVHKDGILRTTRVPATLPRSLQTDAVLLASRILAALDYIGVMGIELFVTPGGLIVNEIAPRVHNSGHWTQNGCAVDQFEQHIRAVCGWPLAPAERHSDVEMTNLIGDEVEAWKDVVADGLHLYGKAEARPGRKMGHINKVIS